jgi:pimeloyl-ACP methyl ester carboxylesterase
VRHPLILLPGILMPAALRYQPLLAALGPEVDAVPKDLEVYAAAAPPPDYSIAAEVAGVLRAADQAGFDTFHLYGHSGGGAVAIATACAHPQRVRSLALDEPAFDFSDAEHAAAPWAELDDLGDLPVPEQMARFARAQLAPGVQPPPPPAGPPPPWMATRPAGVRAFITAAGRHRIPDEAFHAMTAPVSYSLGSLSNPTFADRCQRLASLFHNFRAERYDGLHHLNTSHQAQPQRVAATLRDLWAAAGG